MITVGVIEDSAVESGLIPLKPDVRMVVANASDAFNRDLTRAEVVFVWPGGAAYVKRYWQRFTRVMWIHSATAGVDQLLFPELIRAQVALTNSRNIFDRSVAEYTLGLILLLANDFKSLLSNQTNHRWESYQRDTLFDKTLVVIGVGPIGRAIAGLAKSFGMHVIGVARTARTDREFGLIHAVSDVGNVVAEADYVVVTVPSTSQTRGLIGEPELKRMKATARVINVGRGATLDQLALAHALKDGLLAGAALDVFEKEPLLETDPLWDLPNLVVSPHIGGVHAGWRREAVDLFVENLQRWLAHEPLVNVVDKNLGYVPSIAP